MLEMTKAAADGKVTSHDLNGSNSTSLALDTLWVVEGVIGGSWINELSIGMDTQFGQLPEYSLVYTVDRF